MDEHKKIQLQTYLRMIEKLALEMLQEDPNRTALESLHYASNIVQGQMQGY